MTPPLRHLDKAEDILKRGLYNYRLRYYEFTDQMPPLLSFMVIDADEVIIAFYRSKILPGEQEIRLAIKHPRIVALFQDYYNTIWHAAPKTLEGSTEANLKMLQEIRSRLQ